MTKDSGMPLTDSIRRRQINAHRPSPKVTCSHFFLVGISMFHNDAAEEVHEEGTYSCPPGRHPKTLMRRVFLSFFFLFLIVFNTFFYYYFSPLYPLLPPYPFPPPSQKDFNAMQSWSRLSYLISSVQRHYQLLSHVIHSIRDLGKKSKHFDKCTCLSSDTTLFQKCENETNDLPVELRICIAVMCLCME